MECWSIMTRSEQCLCCCPRSGGEGAPGGRVVLSQPLDASKTRNRSPAVGLLILCSWRGLVAEAFAESRNHV